MSRSEILKHQAQQPLTLATRGQGLYEITDQVSTWVHGLGAHTGQLCIYSRHTSASLTIQENADSDVCRDINTFFTRLVREDPSLYRHTAEGSDDMPAHIRSALTDVSLNIPIVDGRLALGIWQGIYLFEHRTKPHIRTLILHALW